MSRPQGWCLWGYSVLCVAACCRVLFVAACCLLQRVVCCSVLCVAVWCVFQRFALYAVSRFAHRDRKPGPVIFQSQVISINTRTQRISRYSFYLVKRLQSCHLWKFHNIRSDTPLIDHLVMREFVSGPPSYRFIYERVRERKPSLRKGSWAVCGFRTEFFEKRQFFGSSFSF